MSCLRLELDFLGSSPSLAMDNKENTKYIKWFQI